SIVYKKENLGDVYQKLFGEAIEEYNAKQTRADRKMNISKIMCSLKAKAFREVTVQFQCSNDSEIDVYFESAKKVLDTYLKSFEERNPCLKIFNAEMYLEKMPRLHIDFVPVCHGHKRGLSTTVSFRGALAEQGFYSKDCVATEQIIWSKREKTYLDKLWLQERKRCRTSSAS
ncbi:MAG: plasmid recombination protein, partial [Oscillospiraceae bacterium]